MTFRHNTEIGQNFLVDKSVVRWMMERSGAGPGDRVLEIGPGDGILTRGILETGCARVDAVEVDKRLKEYLEPLAASDSRLRLYWADAVTFDYAAIDEIPTHIIANLPYHITTPVIWKLIESYAGKGTRYMLLMTQEEAASRVVSGAGARESCPLSVTIASMGNAVKTRNVPRTAFRPAPKVDSAIVEINLSPEEISGTPLPRDKMWRKLLNGSFALRRKTLVNNWAGSFHIKKEDCAAVLASHSLSALSRPEELSLSGWKSLREDAKLISLLTPDR